MDCTEHTQQTSAKTLNISTSSEDMQRPEYIPGPLCVAATEPFSIRLFVCLTMTVSKQIFATARLPHNAASHASGSK